MAPRVDIEAEADAIAKKYPAFPGPVCSIAAHPYRELIEALIRRKVAGTRVKAALMKEKNSAVSEYAVTRHAKGECVCSLKPS